jgi:PAS domain S-box-containing protein
MQKPLRVLMVEDSEDDALLTIRALKKGGYELAYQRIETAEAMRNALREKTWDLILCDYQLPQFSGLTAIALLKESGIDLPLIIVSGTIGEETAVECMLMGAQDYIMKDNLSRLVPAIERELKEVESRSKHKQAEEVFKDRAAELTLIYENAPFIMILADREWKIRKTNALTTQFVGRAIGDMINRRCGESLHCIHSLDTPEGCGFGPACGECTLRLTILNTIETGQSHQEVEVMMSLFKGEKIRDAVFHLSSARLTVKREPLALVSMQDITERKQAEELLRRSEENFRHSFDDSPLGVRIVNVDGETIYANRSILDIYGLDSLEELKATPAMKRYTPKSYAEFQFRREKRQQGIDIPSEYAIDIIRKDGQVRHLQVLRKEISWDGESQFQVIYQDFTERKQADEKLKTSRLQLRALYKRLQKIREEERLLVAREIHDQMGGGLTGLKMDLSWLLRKLGKADHRKALDACQDKIASANSLIDQMIGEVRRISTSLRPSILDDLGLIAALEWQLSEFTKRTAIPHEFATTCEYIALEEDTAVAVFRIFQEALTNVVRHSRATTVVVDLREGEKSLFGDDSFVLKIRDNGRGITRMELLNTESLGLLGMKERVLTFGGDLSICAEPAGGTSLVLQIPRRREKQHD